MLNKIKSLQFNKEEKVALNLSEFLKENIELYKSLIKKYININLDLSSKKFILISPIEIEQILMNLIVNASQAIEMDNKKEKKEINITVKDINNKVMLSVEDSGIGMDEKTEEKIFTPLFTTKSKGSGLGMFIVKEIIEKNNGEIEVISQKGIGTKITIKFPVYHQKKDKIIELKKEKVKINKKATILYIENDSQILNIYTEILKEKGFKIIPVESGKEALNILKELKSKPEIIILNIILPDIDGINLAEEIMKKLKKVKFLFTFGYVENIELPKKIRSNSLFLQKPFTAERLLSKINTLLSN